MYRFFAKHLLGDNRADYWGGYKLYQIRHRQNFMKNSLLDICAWRLLH